MTPKTSEIREIVPPYAPPPLIRELGGIRDQGVWELSWLLIPIKSGISDHRARVIGLLSPIIQIMLCKASAYINQESGRTKSGIREWTAEKIRDLGGGGPGGGTATIVSNRYSPSAHAHAVNDDLFIS